MPRIQIAKEDHGRADALKRAFNRASPKHEREQLRHFFRKIQEAAYDGQNGSANYAFDRLALIQALATTALHKLEK